MPKFAKLFLVFCLGAGVVTSVAAQRSQPFGSWSAGQMSEGEGLFAATSNDSGNVLGQYCVWNKDSCFYIIAFKTACELNSEYPVLVNADTGALPLRIRCDGVLTGGSVNGFYRYVFTDFKTVDRLVKEATNVGFALPLQKDEFRVIRFDLNGSNEAIAHMRTAATASAPQARATRPTRGTRDQRL